MKILVIDDEKPTLSMFNLFLSAYGYEVHVAEDGEKGLDLFSKEKPDIVFTDIKMPGIDGLEVLRRIKKTGIETEVIIITGHGDMEKAVEALDLDASDFINKPVERQALDDALNRAEKRKKAPKNVPFEIFGELDGKSLLLSINGKMTRASEQLISNVLAGQDIERLESINLLFYETFSINRSGLTLLTRLLQDFRNKGIGVTMKALSYNYIRVFEMVGMDKLSRVIPPGTQ